MHLAFEILKIRPFVAYLILSLLILVLVLVLVSIFVVVLVFFHKTLRNFKTINKTVSLYNFKTVKHNHFFQGINA